MHDLHVYDCMHIFSFSIIVSALFSVESHLPYLRNEKKIRGQEMDSKQFITDLECFARGFCPAVDKRVADEFISGVKVVVDCCLLRRFASIKEASSCAGLQKKKFKF